MAHLRKDFFATLTAVVASLVLSSLASASVVRVPADFSSIQEAINNASSGDEVIVSPGRYIGAIKLKYGVAVRSKGTDEERKQFIAAKRTIIDANTNKEPVVEGADNAVIDGFTLTGLGKVNHHLPGHPHGVNCRGTSPTITNNIITGIGSTAIGSHNQAGKQASPIILHNVVYANDGLGIGNNQGSAAIIRDNIVYGNTEVGIGCTNGSHPLIENNTVYDNGWNGISAKDGAYPIIRNNIVFNNGYYAGEQLIGVGIGGQGTTIPLIEGNTVFRNKLGGIGLRNGASSTIRNNEIYENGGGINMMGAVNVVIEGNKIYNNALSGINAMDTSGIVTGNSIYNNALFGIAPAPGTYLITKDNDIHGNTREATIPTRGMLGNMFGRQNSGHYH